MTPREDGCEDEFEIYGQGDTWYYHRVLSYLTSKAHQSLPHPLPLPFSLLFFQYNRLQSTDKLCNFSLEQHLWGKLQDTSNKDSVDDILARDTFSEADIGLDPTSDSCVGLKMKMDVMSHQRHPLGATCEHNLLFFCKCHPCLHPTSSCPTFEDGHRSLLACQAVHLRSSSLSQRGHLSCLKVSRH